MSSAKVSRAANKELIIVAGANGTGKTTFALEFVANYGVEYLGADRIAEELSPGDVTRARFQAGKEFILRVNERLNGSKSFVIETTLSGVGMKRTIELARRFDFSISIIYLYLDSPDLCISRVSQRVRKGGHHVPQADVRRRFVRSITNFWNVYRQMADNWVIVYNAMTQSQDVATGSKDQVAVRDSNQYCKFLNLVSTRS